METTKIMDLWERSGRAWEEDDDRYRDCSDLDDTSCEAEIG